jgi:Fic family protein
MYQEADMEADTKTVLDRGESISQMEPVRLGETSRGRSGLIDLVVELAQKSAAFRRSLPEEVGTSLADLIRAMNCYYSNLIEGHNTHPVDIERALNNDYSQDARKRDLQHEAKAHIAVQQWIDGGGIAGRAVTAGAIQELHQRFCDQLPEDLLWVEDPQTGERVRVVGGEWRTHGVKVGQHVAVSPGALPRFLALFESAFADLGKTELILACAAAHHRLLWMHPFLDGNGRVARLMSHAMLAETLDTGALWSVARGLARNEAAYKAHLAACDQPRRHDLDGRGALSEEALLEFTRFFLTVCIDQVAFLEHLMEPNRFRARVLLWAEEEVRVGALPPKSGSVLEAILYRGALARGDVEAVVGTGERQARRVVAPLLARGVVVSDSSRAPLRLAFPAALAGRWMPGLFPDQTPEQTAG